MKTSLSRLVIIFLLFSIQQMHSQFAIVSAPDGYSNIRETPSKSGRILERIESGSMIFCIESEESNWKNLDVYNTDGSIKATGYIYKNRIKPVEEYPKVPVAKTAPSSVTLRNNDIEIVMAITDFDVKKHKLSYTLNGSFLDKIDGENIWGTDGIIPKKQYGTFTILLKNKKITLPKKALENLYEPNFKNTFANYDKANDILYVYAFNSDGAGGYGVMWKIEKGIYKERIVRFTS